MSYKAIIYISNAMLIFLLEVTTCCVRFLVPNVLPVVRTRVLGWLRPCWCWLVVACQVSRASTRHPVKVDMWSWVLRRHRRPDQLLPKTLWTHTPLLNLVSWCSWWLSWVSSWRWARPSHRVSHIPSWHAWHVTHVSTLEEGKMLLQNASYYKTLCLFEWQSFTNDDAKCQMSRPTFIFLSLVFWNEKPGNNWRPWHKI